MIQPGFSSFAEHYALVTLSDGGGILLDLRRGSYFQLNATAATICQALATAVTLERAVDTIVDQLSLPGQEVTRLLSSVWDGLSQKVPRELPTTPLSYGRASDGSWVLSENGCPIFAISDSERHLQLCSSLDDLTAPIASYLQALVPKLLALLDVPILHAASCRIGHRFLAFSGRSGAGKTTTAFSFRRAGAEIVSEDLLVVDAREGEVLVALNGEGFSRAWARRTASSVQETPQKPISYEELTLASNGPLARLEALWLLADDRRAGFDLVTKPLSPTDGTAALLGTGLLASSYAQQWRSFLERSRQIAESTPLFEVTVPLGLAKLDQSIRSYMENSAS